MATKVVFLPPALWFMWTLSTMLAYLPITGTAVGGEGWTGWSVFRLKENGPYRCRWFESATAQLLWAHLLRALLFWLIHFSFRAIPLVSFRLVPFRLTPIFNPEAIGSCPFISHPFFIQSLASRVLSCHLSSHLFRVQLLSAQHLL